jgi:hypothetical protein
VAQGSQRRAPGLGMVPRRCSIAKARSCRGLQKRQLDGQLRIGGGGHGDAGQQALRLLGVVIL